jgi:hypothetical protein
MALQQNIFTRRENKPVFTRDGFQIIKEEPFQRGFTYLDTHDTVLKIPENTGEDDAFAFVQLASPTGVPLLGKQINKFAVYNVGLFLGNTQITVRNNIVQFYSSNTGTLNGAGKFISPSVLHSGVITSGSYSNADTLVDGLIIAMNGASGVSGLTFSKAKTLNADGLPASVKYTITAVGGGFAWASGGDTSDPGYPMDDSNVTNLTLTRGTFLYNLSRSQTSSFVKNIGAVRGCYTRYIDLI